MRGGRLLFGIEINSRNDGDSDAEFNDQNQSSIQESGLQPMEGLESGVEPGTPHDTFQKPLSRGQEDSRGENVIRDPAITDDIQDSQFIERGTNSNQEGIVGSKANSAIENQPSVPEKALTATGNNLVLEPGTLSLPEPKAQTASGHTSGLDPGILSIASQRSMNSGHTSGLEPGTPNVASQRSMNSNSKTEHSDSTLSTSKSGEETNTGSILGMEPRISSTASQKTMNSNSIGDDSESVVRKNKESDANSGLEPSTKNDASEEPNEDT